MAKAPNAAAAQAAEERLERDQQVDINNAVAATEDEIFREALSEEELDNDGDRSLEEMGDGLEGDEGDIEDDEVDDRTDTDVDDEETEAEGEGLAAEGEGEPQDRGPPPPMDDRRIPPGRLREEADRRRAAESTNEQLARELAETRGRLDELSRRVNAPPQQQQPQPPPMPKPDMFADPEGYEHWLIEQNDQRVRSAVSEALASDRRDREARDANRVNVSLEQASRGDRSFEFTAAYQALTSLDPKDPAAQQSAYRIMQAADPAAALFDWWEENGGPEYREQMLESLLPEDLRQPVMSRMRGGQPQARHQARPSPRGNYPPSLNSARGGQRQQTADPDMLDGSDASVFEYATRR
jgi:hypothetical protein